MNKSDDERVRIKFTVPLQSNRNLEILPAANSVF